MTHAPDRKSTSLEKDILTLSPKQLLLPPIASVGRERFMKECRRAASRTIAGPILSSFLGKPRVFDYVPHHSKP